MRVHPPNPFVLFGIVVALSPACAEEPCGGQSSVRVMPRHHTEILDPPRFAGSDSASFGPQWCVTDWATAPFEFGELLVSWNVERPRNVGFLCEIRVQRGGAAPSPWLEVGSAGDVAPDRERAIEFGGGRIDVDWFRANGVARFDRVAARFRAVGGECRVARLSYCFTDRDTGVVTTGGVGGLPESDLAVPFRSQRSAREDLRGRICSPTSLSMVLAYRGIDRPPETVAAAVFDAEHDVYGNWPRSIQGAFEAGVPGYLTRFSNWHEVAATLAQGQPIIASIGVTAGQLTGAPYESTQGHLIVLRGIDAQGDVRVNDPAAGDEEGGVRVYRRTELDVVWMQRGGTAYLLLPREPSGGAR